MLFLICGAGVSAPAPRFHFPSTEKQDNSVRGVSYLGGFPVGEPSWSCYLRVGETSRSRCNRAARPPGPRRQKAPLHRRARACPSPSFAQSNARGKPARMRVWYPRPPRYGEKTVLRSVGPKTSLLTMAIAGETRSDARMASEGPRATGRNQDQEGSPTGVHRFMKHSQLNGSGTGKNPLALNLTSCYN